MSMEWLRWYHGCVTDPKFTLIARRSSQNVASVLAVWAALLERASQADERGSVDGFDCESFDALFGLEDGACQAIISAMADKGMIQGSKIAKWRERQPLKEDSTATERKRQQRERDRAEKTDLSRDVTLGHDLSRDVTPRLDKIREEKNLNTHGTTGELDRARASGGAGEAPVDEPGIEFLELRELYDQVKPEAPLSGFAEYKQLRAGRRWPGIGRIAQGIDALSRHDGQFRDGFAPGLARFLRERWWEKEPTPARARASPAGSPQSDLTAKNMSTAAKVLARRAQRDKEAFDNAMPG